MSAENVRVMARVNPRPGNVCLALEGEQTIVPVEEDGQKHHHRFGFDHVFNQQSQQEDVFQRVGVPTIEKVMEGYNGTVFAYGQSGSGKTHTMLAPEGGSAKCLDPKNAAAYAQRGLIPRMATALFDRLSLMREAYKNTEFVVRCCFYEIYNEELLDLLAEPKAAVGPGGKREEKKIRLEGTKETFKIIGLVPRELERPEDLLDLIQAGTARRHVASTNMNDRSSRSHSIVQINIEQKDKILKTVTTAQLNLVDLAGCESLGRTGAKGQTAQEGMKINLSLTTLGIVINQLCKGEKYISFRDSMLTRVLQNSLGGNTLTTLIVTMSQLRENYSDTVSVLRFAERAKQIKNKARVNKQRSAAEWEMLFKQAEEEIETLKQRLSLASTAKTPAVAKGPGGTASGYDDSAFESLRAKMDKALEEQEEQQKLLLEKERELFESTQKLQALEAELQKLNESLQMLDLEKKENYALYEATLKDVELLRNASQKERDQKQDLMSQIKSLQEEATGAKEEVKMLRDSEKEREVVDVRLQNEVQQKAAEVAALQKQLAGKDDELNRVREDQRREKLSWVEQEQGYKNQINALRTSGGAGASIEEAIQSALNQQDETMKILKAEMEALREENHGLRHKTVEQATVVANSEGELRSYKDQVEMLNAIIKRSKSSHEELANSNRRIATELAGMKEENKALTDRLSTQERGTATELRSVQKERDNLLKELEALRERVAKQESEIAEKDETIEYLQNRIRELELANTRLEGEAETLRKQNDTLVHQVRAGDANLKEANNNISYIQEAIKGACDLVRASSLGDAEKEQILAALTGAADPKSKDQLTKLAARLYDDSAQRDLLDLVTLLMQERSAEVPEMTGRVKAIIEAGDVMPDTLEANLKHVHKELAKMEDVLSLRSFNMPEDESMRKDFLTDTRVLRKGLDEYVQEVEEYAERMSRSKEKGEAVCPMCGKTFPKSDIKNHFDREH